MASMARFEMAALLRRSLVAAIVALTLLPGHARADQTLKIGYFDVMWPKQYAAAKSQLERNLERERAQVAANAGLSPQERAQRAEGTV